MADLLHHLRGDLTPSQITRICNLYLRHLHNPYTPNQLHVLAGKVLYNLIEVITVKDTPQDAARLLSAILDASVDKLETMAVVVEEVMAKIEATNKGEAVPIDYPFIEKSRPVAGAVYALEKPEDVLIGMYPYNECDVLFI